MKMLVLILFCIVVSSVEGSNDPEEPEVFFTPFSRFKPKSQVTLSCRIEQHHNVVSIQYIRNDILLSPTVDKRIVRGNEYTLIISSLDRTIDDGEYRCIVKTTKGVLRSLKKRLRVKELGVFQNGNKYTDAVKTIDVVVGRGFILRCPTASYTFPRTILWGNVPQLGRPMLLWENRRRFKLSNGNLMFSFVSEEDINEVNNRLKGVSCIFYHNGPYVQSVRYLFNRVAEFKNNFQPNFVEVFSKAISGNEGEPVKLSCSAYGRPTPRVQWIGPKGEIDSTNTDYQISPSGNILSIPVAYPRLAGKYRCNVKNSVGQISKEGELKVNALLRWVSMLQDIEANAGDSVKLTIKAVGSDILQYDWFKNGQRISASNSTYQLDENALTLKLKSKDFAYIQVFASNNVNEISSAAFIASKGASIPASKEVQRKQDYGGYILIGAAALIVLGVIIFIIYMCLKCN